ncbi:MAG: hypothetical protein KC503_09405 [Myxococcales bacterium]|nr:hypothetical protein [Myxococcales bacterium]
MRFLLLALLAGACACSARQAPQLGDGSAQLDLAQRDVARDGRAAADAARDLGPRDGRPGDGRPGDGRPGDLSPARDTSADHAPRDALGADGAASSRWTPLPLAPGTSLHWIAGSSALGQVMAVASWVIDSSYVLQLDGSGWRQVGTQSTSPRHMWVNTAWRPGSTNKFALTLGINKVQALSTPSSNGFLSYAYTATSYLFASSALWAARASAGGLHIFVGNHVGTMLHWLDTAPRAGCKVYGFRRIRALWSVDPFDGSLVIAGDDGLIARYSDKTQTCIDDNNLATKTHLRALWGSAADALFAVGDAGTILNYDGKAWRAMTSPVSAELRALSGGAGKVYAVGDHGGAGVMLRFDGSSWGTVALPPGTKSLDAVWVNDASGEVYVGGQGTALLLRP